VVAADAGDEESTAQSSKKNSTVAIDLRFIPTPKFFYLTISSRYLSFPESGSPGSFRFAFHMKIARAIFIVYACVPARIL
jgi:hypothetical protein